MKPARRTVALSICVVRSYHVHVNVGPVRRPEVGETKNTVSVPSLEIVAVPFVGCATPWNTPEATGSREAPPLAVGIPSSTGRSNEQTFRPKGVPHSKQNDHQYANNNFPLFHWYLPRQKTH